MSIEDWENRNAPADGELSAEEDRYREVEELLFVDWRLILQIERAYREQQELMLEFEEELDELFALIHSPELPQDESPDPPGWPAL